MKKNMILFVLVACVIFLSSTPIKAQVLTDFYNYTPNDDGYKVSINTKIPNGQSTSFGTELDKSSDGVFTDSNGYVWRTGDPLPNPAPDGLYNGKPVNSMAAMFYCCSAINLNLSKFDTHNVTNMGGMFDWCSKLNSLFLSNFDTKKVTNMNMMFRYCLAITILEISSFDTSAVTDMSSMFQSSNISGIYVKNFNTKNVTNMNSMFANCTNLQSIDLSSFNTQNVTNMEGMFQRCNSLRELDISNFNTAKVTNMNYMFSECSAITNLDISGFTFEASPTFTSMFSKCGLIVNNNPAKGLAGSSEAIDKFNTKDTGINSANLSFSLAPRFTDFYTYVENGDGYKVSLNYSFKDSFNKGESYTGNNGYVWNVNDPLPNPAHEGMYNGKPVIDMSLMFQYSTPITKNLDLSKFNTKNVRNMNYMFEGSTCESIDLSSFNTAKVTTMAKMFNNCTNLKTLDLSNFNTSNVSNMIYMFSNCSQLTDINLSKFNTSKVVEMYDMFSGCSALTSLDLSSFNTKNVTNMDAMFNNCYNITHLDLSNFSVSEGTSAGWMFSNCGKAANGTPAEGCTFTKEMADLFNSNLSIDISRLKFAMDAVLTDFYTYTDNNDGYKVALSNGFRTNFKDNKTFTDSKGHVFNSGDPLPNPAKGGLYNGKPVTDMSNLFNSCIYVVKLDLSNFDMHNVINMKNLFLGCTSLTSVYISSFNTQNVKNMSSIFRACSNLQNIDLSSFNTQNVTDMSEMFYDCTNLVKLDLSSFNTQNVTNMRSMFFNCSSLESLDLSNFVFNTNVFYFSMFYLCGKADGSGQAGIGVVKDWDAVNRINEIRSTNSLDTKSLNFGIKVSYCNEPDTKALDYVLFQDHYSEANKKATLVASRTEAYRDYIDIAEIVTNGAKEYPVTAIAPYTFKDCTALTGVGVSNKITKVGDYAFTGSKTNLTLKMHSDIPPMVTECAFDPNHYFFSYLRVHPEAAQAYASDSVWKKFINRQTDVESVVVGLYGFRVIRTKDGARVVGVAAGDIVSVYTTSGTMLKSIKASDTTVELDGIASGTYIILVNSKSMKVVL